MKKAIHIKVIIILILSVYHCSVYAQESYNLQYKFEKGKNYRYSAETTSNSEQIFNNLTTPSSGMGYSILRFHIADFQKDIYSVYISYDSLYSKSENTVSTTVNNGEKVKGKRTLYSIDRKGTLLRKEFVDSLTNWRITGYLGTNLVHKLAVTDVKTGSLWSSKTIDTILTVGNKIIANTSADYKVEGKEKINGHDCLKISFSANSAFNGITSRTSYVNDRTMEVLINLDGKAKLSGVFYFDYSLGIIISSENNVKTDEVILVDSMDPVAMTTEYKAVLNLIE